MMKRRITYANVTSTLALVLALGGGAAFAAVHLGKGEVKARNIHGRAVTNPKLAPRTVTAGKIANGAVFGDKIAAGTISGSNVGLHTITPDNLAFPVRFVATAKGGQIPIVSDGNQHQYPLSGNSWVQGAEELDPGLFGQTTGTIAYDGTDPSNQCQVNFAIYIDGQQVGGGNSLQNGSTTPIGTTSGLNGGGFPDPGQPTQRTLTIAYQAVGCSAGSTLDLARIRVLGLG